MLRQSTLTSIPERNEIEDEPSQKWVPKKKHEVLKAKYKCLKKLFQIYDASNNSIYLPEPVENIDEDTRTKRRRKRSHRTKTDACAGTNELSSGDMTHTELQFECDNDSISTTMMRNLKTKQSCSTQIECSKFETNASNLESYPSKLETKASIDVSRYAETNDSKDDLCRKDPRECKCNLPHPIPYLVLNERRKLTRFQCFVQRIFGIRRSSCMLQNDAYATVSDSQRERWKRRGLRFRRLRRAKKIRSDSDLKDMKGPAIISYVQSVQRNCLADTTPRLCPILGCGMICYGIINYNDHINISHFKNRKYICHYCHEGFEREYDKYIHENEHLGLSKLSTNVSNLTPTRNNLSSNSDTQTEPETRIPDEKLKKIVSFFDKITNPDEIVSEVRKNRSSETNLTKMTEVESSSESQNSYAQRTVSCVNIHKCKCQSYSSSVTSQSGTAPVTCLYCGENFEYKEQLRCHVDLEHKMEKYKRSHSCTGVLNRYDPRILRDLRGSRPSQDLYEDSLTRSQQCSNGSRQRDLYERTQRDLYGHRPTRELVSDDGRLNVLSVDSSRVHQTYTEVSAVSSPTPSEETIRGRCDESLTCDPSTNIVYYTSMESVKKPSVVENLLKKVKSYRWEPNTKIIRV